VEKPLNSLIERNKSINFIGVCCLDIFTFIIKKKKKKTFLGDFEFRSSKRGDGALKSKSGGKWTRHRLSTRGDLERFQSPPLDHDANKDSLD
jgi:hypothetical protein